MSQILCVRFFPRKEVKNCQRIRGKPENVLEDTIRDLFCFQDLPLFCISARFCQEKKEKAWNLDTTASLDLDTTASLDLDTTASLDLDTTASLDLDTTASLDLDTTASLDLDTTASLYLDTTASLDLDTTASLYLDTTASLDLDNTTPTASLNFDNTTPTNVFGVISFRVWTVPPMGKGNQSPPVDAKIVIVPKQPQQQQLIKPGSNFIKISGRFCKFGAVS
jgi:hypothetical protein